MADEDEAHAPTPDLKQAVAEAVPHVAAPALATVIIGAVMPDAHAVATLSAAIVSAVMRIGTRMLADERLEKAARAEETIRSVALAAEVDDVTDELRSLAAAVGEVVRAQRLAPVVKEVARLAASGVFAGSELHTAEEVPPHLADALFRSFRDAADAIDPRTAPAFGRLATLYATRPMDRAGRALGQLLMHLEGDEWILMQELASAIDAELERVESLGGRPRSITFVEHNPHATLNVRTMEPPHRGPDPELRWELVPLMRLLRRYDACDFETSNSVTFEIAGARRFVWITTGIRAGTTFTP